MSTSQGTSNIYQQTRRSYVRHMEKILSQLLEGTNLFADMDLGLLASRIVETIDSCCSRLSVCGTLLWQP